MLFLQYSHSTRPRVPREDPYWPTRERYPQREFMNFPRQTRPESFYQDPIMDSYHERKSHVYRSWNPRESVHNYTPRNEFEQERTRSGRWDADPLQRTPPRRSADYNGMRPQFQDSEISPRRPSYHPPESKSTIENGSTPTWNSAVPPFEIPFPPEIPNGLPPPHPGYPPPLSLDSRIIPNQPSENYPYDHAASHDVNKPPTAFFPTQVPQFMSNGKSTPTIKEFAQVAQPSPIIRPSSLEAEPSSNPPAPSPPSEEEDNLPTLQSKEAIITQMDHLDTDISQIEEEIENLRKLKIDCQKQADRTNLSDVDKLLLTNQEKVAENVAQMKIYQVKEATSKVKPNFVYQPENILKHKWLRPRMMFAMKLCLFEKKTKEKQSMEVYCDKKENWYRKLRSSKINTTGVDLLIAPVEPVPAPLPPVNSPATRIRTTRRSIIAEMKNEDDYGRNLQQLQRQTDEPNRRFMKTLVKIPALLTDKRELNRKFIDNNRLVEDPVGEYLTSQITNPWSEEEQQIFVQKFKLFPKQFGVIATFLENKSIEDVIKYYFQNKIRLNLKNIIKEAANNPKKRGPKPRGAAARMDKKPAGLSREIADLQGNPTTSNYWNIPRSARTRDRTTRLSQSKDASDTEKPTEEKKLDKTVIAAKVNKVKSKTKPKLPTQAAPPTAAITRPKRITKTNASNDKLVNHTPSTKKQESTMDLHARSAFFTEIPSCWTESEVDLFKHALTTHGKDFKSIADFIFTKNQFECQSYYYNHFNELQNAKRPDSTKKRNRTQKPTTSKRKKPKRSPVATQIPTQPTPVPSPMLISSFPTVPAAPHIPNDKSALLNKGSIASLLNSPLQQNTETSDWVLDEPDQTFIHSTSPFASSSQPTNYFPQAPLFNTTNPSDSSRLFKNFVDAPADPLKASNMGFAKFRYTFEPPQLISPLQDHDGKKAADWDVEGVKVGLFLPKSAAEVYIPQSITTKINEPTEPDTHLNPKLSLNIPIFPPTSLSQPNAYEPLNQHEEYEKVPNSFNNSTEEEELVPHSQQVFNGDHHAHLEPGVDSSLMFSQEMVAPNNQTLDIQQSEVSDSDNDLDLQIVDAESENEIIEERENEAKVMVN